MKVDDELVDEIYEGLPEETRTRVDAVVDEICSAKEKGGKVCVVTGSGPNLHEGVTTLIAELMTKGIVDGVSTSSAVVAHEMAGSLERVYRVSGSEMNLDPDLLPPLFIAFKTRLGKVSGHALNEIRIGYDRGDKRIVDTLSRLAELAEKGRQALLQGDSALLHDLMNENFDLRSTIMKISDSNHEMVETARRCGAAAKFSGSGGSVIGMYTDDDMLARLTDAFNKIEATVIKPVVTERELA